MSSLLPSWHRVSMAALIMVRDKEKVFSQDSSSAGGRGGAVRVNRHPPVAAPLASHPHSPTMRVLVSSFRCAALSPTTDRMWQQVATLTSCPLVKKKNQSKSTGEG